MKRYIYLFMLVVVAMATACKADPDAINNTPEVFVDEAGDLLRTSAVLTGHIMAPGKAPIKEYGFLVSPTSDFSGAETQTIRCDEGFNEFAAQVTGLEIDHSYFYAAYASNGRERILSTVRAFTTPTRSGVLLTDLRLEDEKRATLSARVADTGGGEINAVGLCWAADKTPTTYDKTILTELNADKTFTASLTGLEAGKTYYVRAFADSDILGDGTTQTISYSRDVVEIRLEEELPEPEPEPTWMLSGSLQGGENEIYFVEDSERGMFVAEDVNLTLRCRFKVYQVEDRGVAYGYADQTRTTHDMVDARLPLDLNGEDIEPTHAGVFDIWFDLDGKYLYIMSDDKTPEEADDYEPKPTGPASNEIWYTSTDGNIVEPYDATGFGVNIVSNTYENGKGVITFDGEVKTIGRYSFAYRYNLLSMTIPNSVTNIGLMAYFSSYCMTDVNIPEGVISIEQDAYGGCYDLTHINLPESLTEFGFHPFRACSGLLNFSGKYASEDGRFLMIGDKLVAFAPAGLTEYSIPQYVTQIGEFAMCGETLTTVYMPNTITTIEEWAFHNCRALTSIHIPESVTSLSVAFMGCSKLAAFSGKYATDDGRWLIDNGVLKGVAPAGMSDFVIPDSVVAIGRFCFQDCKLTEIVIPDNVTEIMHQAFYDCNNLTTVHLGRNLTSISAHAFNYCSKLSEVYCDAVTPPAGKFTMFDNNAPGRKIYVPNASVEAYKSAYGWSDYASDIVGYDF